MFCRSCGKYNPESEQKCKYCGGVLVNDESCRREVCYSQDKGTIGILMAIFLGVIGLIIGLLIYTGYERVSFLSGWLKGLVGCIILCVALVGFVCCLPYLY